MAFAAVQVLGEAAIRQKVRRMAWEVVENNPTTPLLSLVGINQRGFRLATYLHDELRKIAKPPVRLLNAKVGREVSWHDARQQPRDKHLLFPKEDSLSFLFVDDVLNSGETLLRGIAEVVPLSPQKIEIAVLVERSHKRYPLAANYKGCSLSTTLNDHVQVRMNGERGVYLQQKKGIGHAIRESL